MNNEVKIRISTDPSAGVAGINQFKASMASLESASGGFISKMKSQWMGVSASIYAAYAVIQKGIALMDEGARATQQESSFKIMADEAGVNSARMIASMQAATRETIDDSDLMQKASKLMLAGYNPEQIERFSKVVITASQYAGTTASEAFDSLGDAIANRTPKALVLLGAVTREQMKVVSEAIKNGADSMSLYELAMSNLELKYLRLMGTQDQETISMQRFHAEVKDTGETLGKMLNIGLQKAFSLFQYIGAGSLVASANIYKAVQAMDILISHMPGTDKL